MKIIKLLTLSIAAVVLTGCAHSLVISPEITKIEKAQNVTSIKKNVAYIISDENRAKEVTTPGGGGDKVSYLPYRDIETAFYKMLSNVFEKVTLLKSPQEKEKIQANSVSFLFTPTIVTTSSSPSPLTWPPTIFSLELTCTISDANGGVVATKKVTGQGRAEFDEFRKDFALSAKRASEDALLKMQQVLLDSPELRK